MLLEEGLSNLSLGDYSWNSIHYDYCSIHLVLADYNLFEGSCYSKYFELVDYNLFEGSCYSKYFELVDYNLFDYNLFDYNLFDYNLFEGSSYSKNL